MMRRALLVAFLAAALLPLGLRAQTITAAPGGSMTSLVGMPFDVPFYLDMTARPERLGAFAARVQWNPAVLQLDGGSDGTFGNVTVNEDSLTSGVARIAGANPAGVGGLITLGALHFTPLVTQADTIHLSVTELFAAGSFADLTPSLTTRNGYFCPARGMFGDIDRDGAINSRDALIALSNAVGLDVSAYDVTLGDVDGSGTTNARDALIILSDAVGLPVTGFQVGRLAGGACASTVPLVMTIVPDTVDLVVGQTMAFEARAADSTGILQTVTNAIWKSANTAVLAIAPDGTAQAHDTGTVRVTAIRTALDSAQAVVHIIAHRTRQIVDAAAANARNQLGSAAFPFSQIGQGIAFAQGGDTVEVRVGRYGESVQLDRPAVLMGDTLSDGTRPLVAAPPEPNFGGITLTGTGGRVVRDLAIDGFEAGVDMEGAASALLHGLRITNVVYGVGAGTGPIASVRLESSRLTGLGASSGYSSDGLYFDTPTPVDTLVVQDVEIGDFGGDGVYAPGADSLAVLRSRIHDVGEIGIAAGPGAGDCEECAAPQRTPGRGPPQQAASAGVAVDSSAVLNANYEGIYFDGIRSAVISHSVFNNPEYAVEAYGGDAGGWVRFQRDSIIQPSSESRWLEVEYLDSLAMDSVAVQVGYGEGYVYAVPVVRVTNSQITGIQGGTGLYIGGPSGNGVVTLDNVSVAGDPACDACGTGLSLGNERVTASRLSLTNLYDGIYTYGDSSMAVTNSFFHHIEYPIEWYGSETDSTSKLVVGGTTFLGFYQAIQAYDGGLRVDSSSFLNGNDEAIYFEGSGPAHVVGNTFASVAYGIDLEPYSTYGPWVDTVANNTISDVPYEGIEIYADDSVPFQVLGNSVTCSSGGYGIDVEYAGGTLAGNQANGCEYGIYVYDDNGPALRTDSVLSNTVGMGRYADAGIYAEGSIHVRIAYNTVTGDTVSSGGTGDIYVYGYTPGATAEIDSNAVTGGTFAGIYATYLDTVLVRFNSVQGMRAPWGAIGTHGRLSYLAQIYGNTVRNVRGNGLYLWNSDTAMVVVDSNLVASSDTGVYLYGGADSITRNRITQNAVGLAYESYSVDQNRTLVTENNFEGNLPYGVLQPLEATLQAPNNWWGDPNGPSCQSDCSSSGDSVSGSVNVSPYATTEFGATPPPAAPARTILAARSSSGRVVRAPAPTGLDAPVAHKTRPTVAPRVTAARAAAPGARAGTQPARSGVLKGAWQRTVQQRPASLSSAAQRHAALGAAVARLNAQLTSRELRIQQHKAALDARLKAKQARQAAARAALPRGHGVRQ